MTGAIPSKRWSTSCNASTATFTWTSTVSHGRQQFVEALLDSEPNNLEPAFHQALYQHTGGHALFTVEILRGLQERGDLIKDSAERWTVGARLDWETLPPRVEALIAERIGRLPKCWQTMLTAGERGGRGVQRRDRPGLCPGR